MKMSEREGWRETRKRRRDKDQSQQNFQKRRTNFSPTLAPNINNFFQKLCFGYSFVLTFIFLIHAELETDQPAIPFFPRIVIYDPRLFGLL